MFDYIFEALDILFLTGYNDVAPQNAKTYPYGIHEGSLNFQSIEMLNLTLLNAYALHRKTFCYTTINPNEIRGFTAIGLASGFAVQNQEDLTKKGTVGIDELVKAIKERKKGIYTLFAFSPQKISIGNVSILGRVFTDIRCYRRYNKDINYLYPYLSENKPFPTIFHEINFQLSFNNVFIEPYCQVADNGTRILGIRLFGVQHGFMLEKLSKFSFMSFGDVTKLGLTVTPFVIL